MQAPEDRQVLEFDDFELDLRARTLRRNGEPVAITAKVFDALAVLARHHGRVVEKDDLFRAIWPDTIVEEGNLHHCVSTLRRVLGEKPDERRFIATVPGRGYSFIPSVRVRPQEPVRAPRSGQRRWAILAVSLGLVVMVAGGWIWSRSARPDRVVRAVPLTAAPGLAESPTFSPDGRQIAFSWRPEGETNSHIYFKSIGSESIQQRTSGPFLDSAPAWSPDGRLIAFLRRPESSDELSLCVIPAGGGEPRIFYTRQGRNGNGIQNSWTADSKQLVFVDRESAAASPRLYSLALETGQVRPLTAPAEGDLDLSPAVSPDGKLVAFLRSHGRGWAILVMPLKGGEPKVVLEAGRDVDRAALAWEPDGQHLIYRSTQGGLWEVDLSGTHPQRLRAGGDSADFPAVSSNGDLAFIESSHQIDLDQVDWPGGAAPASTRVVLESTRTVFDPQWSPDGKHIAFYSDRSGSTEIWRCAADGTNLRQLTSFKGPLTRNPRWSPDGTNIAFDSVSGGHGHIHVIPSEGGRDRQLTSGELDNIIPAWSPDGTRLYFASKRSGTFQIWSMPAAGGDATQITFLGGFFSSVSADNYLYYVRAPGGKTLLRMPAGGGAEQIVLDSDLGYHAWWGLTPAGIVYIDRNNALRYVELASRRSTEVLAQFKRDGLSQMSTIAASRDGHSVLCPVITRSMSDVMLVERFW
jgi:Tol biopolymer transport system component/DNA-binding winged helix-turn-helix (wHTH) protein